MTEPASSFRLSDLLERVDGDHEAAVMIARQYAAQRETLLAPLLAALQAADVAAALRLAHELKGMAAMIGATELAEVAGLVHDAVRRGALASVADRATQQRLASHWEAVGRCLAPLAPPFSAA